MSAWLLLLIWLLPLGLASLVRLNSARWLMAVAPIPALMAAAILPDGTTLSLPWLLLGVELGLDTTGRLFLLSSGLLWLAASLFASDMRAQHDMARFRFFFLLAMAGNLGLIVANDMLSFYLGFTLMGLAAYGLVGHSTSCRSRHAAGRYLIWTIAGELLLFVAIILLAAQHAGAIHFDALAGNPPGSLATLLLILGFGIKLALPGLHFWLPQTYAVTPTAAVAVMSGAMINAGLLGWLRFLPIGDTSFINWGYGLMTIGAVAILYGSIFGLIQNKPRRVLAYSSMSKMGLLTLGMGAALAWPGTAPVVLSALLVYAVHHAMVKASLFLGLGLTEAQGLRPWLLVGLGFLALALAGAPLTSGALAKFVLSASLPEQASLLLYALAASAIGTTLLMSRFLYLVWTQYEPTSKPQPALPTLVWLLLLSGIAITPFVYAEAGALPGDSLYLLTSLALAAFALSAGLRLPARFRRHRARLMTYRIARQTGRGIQRCIDATTDLLQRHLSDAPDFKKIRLKLQQTQTRLLQPEPNADQWPITGMLWLAIGCLLLITLITAT